MHGSAQAATRGAAAGAGRRACRTWLRSCRPQLRDAGEALLADLADGQAQLPGERTAAQRSAGDRPFSAKHARQQASIVGHLRRLGLLEARHDWGISCVRLFCRVCDCFY